MTWQKVTVALLSVLFVVTVLVGVTYTAQAQSRPVELEFWGWWASAQRMPTIEKIINQWNAEHPEIQVTYSYVPFDQMMTKYLASVAAGNPPDVVAVPDIFTAPQRGQRRQATNLSELGADELRGEFYDSFWDVVTYAGDAYALPWVGETKYLYYNKDHFAEAGLDPEKGPVTWEDLWAFADRLDQVQGNRIVRMGFHPLLGNFGYQGWVWNAGSVFFDERGWPVVNNEANVEVLDWIKKWTDRYGFRNYAAFKGSFTGGPQEPFIQGRVSMIIQNATWEGELKRYGPDVNYGVVPIPTSDGQQHPTASYTGGFAVEVPYGTRNPQAAFEFARYWVTDAAIIWAEEQNDFPAYRRAADVIRTPEFQRMSDYMAYTGLIPLPLTATTYLDAINPAVDDAIAGIKDSATALAEAQDLVVRMVQESTR